MDKTPGKKTEKYRGRITASLLFLAGGGLLRILSRHLPGFALFWREKANPLLTGSLGRISSLFPFCLGEALLLAVPCLVLFFSAGCLRRIFRKSGGLFSFLLNALSFAVPVLSLVFLLWEANEDVYFRAPSFGETYGLVSEGYSDEELIRACLILTEEVNASAPLAERDASGLMVCGEDLGERVIGKMQDLGETYPWLSGYYPEPRMVFFSKALSYMGFTGIYSVPTVEGCCSRDMPPYNLPFTMAHELSHVKGVMSEKEANFIGWLSGFRSGDPDLRYSSALLGWTYCGRELYKRDREAYAGIRSGICSDAMKDLKYNSEYWKRYEGAVSGKTQKINDLYLKMEGLADGTASYDLVTDMIVTWMKMTGEI